MCKEEEGTGPDCVRGRAMTDTGDCCIQLKSGMVAINVTVWWEELVVCGHPVIHDARPSLFIFAVLSAVLRSGFRDTLQAHPTTVPLCVVIA